MKHTFASAAMLTILSLSATAAQENQLNINTTLANGQSVDVTFDLASFYNIPAISYYADKGDASQFGTFEQGPTDKPFFSHELGNGYVDSGEFVFDIATGKVINRLLLDEQLVAQQSNTAATNVTSTNYGQDWWLSFDYAIYGQAAVIDSQENPIPTYNDFGYTNGTPNQILAAGIQGGIINVFFNDRTNDQGQGREEDALLMSFNITGSSLFGGRSIPGNNLSPGITLNGEMSYAHNEILYTNGRLVSDALNDGAFGSIALNTEVEEDQSTFDANGDFVERGKDGVRDPGTVPGQFNGSVNTPNTDQFGNALAYVNPGYGSQTPASRIINDANNWGTCDPSFRDFNSIINRGLLCNDGLGQPATGDLIPSFVEQQAQNTLDAILQGAGNDMILARVTSPEGLASFEVNGPASISLFGLALLAVGVRRRRS